MISCVVYELWMFWAVFDQSLGQYYCRKIVTDDWLYPRLIILFKIIFCFFLVLSHFFFFLVAWMGITRLWYWFPHSQYRNRTLPVMPLQTTGRRSYLTLLLLSSSSPRLLSGPRLPSPNIQEQSGKIPIPTPPRLKSGSACVQTRPRWLNIHVEILIYHHHEIPWANALVLKRHAFFEVDFVLWIKLMSLKTFTITWNNFSKWQ